jgi:hypothetical protein
MPLDSDYTPFVWNMRLFKGNSWPHSSFSIVDSNNAPRDLSSASVTMQVKPAKGTDVVKALSKGNGFLVSGNTVVFDSIVDLAPGKYTYDITIVYTTGERKTYFIGAIVVKDDTPA